MHFGISTRFFRNERLTVDVLERFRKAKFHRLEIFGNRPHFDFHDRKTLRSIARWFDENETPAPSIHLPFEEPYSRDQAMALPLFAGEARLRQLAIDELKRCMELAEFTTVSHAVMHLGADGDSFNPVLLEYAYAAIAAVQKFSGVRVLIENTLNDASTFERIREFISVAQLQNVGICYDTGHGYLRNLTPELRQIDVIQLNDTDGSRDAHLWPFEGRLNWPALIERITLERFKGDLLFETEGGTLENSKPVSDRLNELVYEADNSIDEFRLKHKLKSKNPDTGEID